MRIRRRTVLGAFAATALCSAGGLLPRALRAAPTAQPIMRKIPSSGEQIPAVGLGSWITFNVGDDPVLLEECTKVIAAFFGNGGRLIDSSPMYGSSQATIGHALTRLNMREPVFAADKIWTSSQAEGPSQFIETRKLWTVPTIDLMQVHNLLSWRAHLEMLTAKKANGEIRYTGITTSHGRRHDELEKIMQSHTIDFVQLTYNLIDREAEKRLLPLARERGIAVIANRPYQRGALVARFAGKPLPPFAAEIEAHSWPQLLLKFAISHPAITCAIPATTRVDHVVENLLAASGPLPDAGMRDKIAKYAAQL